MSKVASRTVKLNISDPKIIETYVKSKTSMPERHLGLNTSFSQKLEKIYVRYKYSEKIEGS